MNNKKQAVRKRFSGTGYRISDGLCFETVIIRSILWLFFGLKVFQTAFAGKAHATGLPDTDLAEDGGWFHGSVL